jgi:hypothetical protein
LTNTAYLANELESKSTENNRAQELKDIEAIIAVIRKSGREPLEADAMAKVLLELSKGLKID